MVREDIASVGKRFRAADRILMDRLIAIHPEPKLVALLRAGQSGVDSDTAIETKAQLEGARQGFREMLKTFEAVASAEDIYALKKQLDQEGLIEAAQLVSNPADQIRKILAKGRIATVSEFRLTSEYAEELFEADNLEELERLNALLADYVKRKSPRST